ncbi:PepSY domain-containing protein [Roseateles sp. BYS78W]|uniref:PepSY domain-containing protein n=1 Tax=Pelomonas candidula TaxID=3299025 RepID=A0ABW7HJ89_9BURK
MNRRYIYALLSASLIAAGALAYAESGEPRSGEPETDAVPVTQAPISLLQAVQTAELRAAGKARQAEYTHGRQGWVYEVEVVSNAGVFDVHVDATNGTVLSSELDKLDRDGRHGEHDDGED